MKTSQSAITRFALRFTAVTAASLPLTAFAHAETPTHLTTLLDSKDLSNWQLIAGPNADLAAICHANADGSLAVSGKPNGFFATKTSYSNYRLHAEWRWPGAVGNGGVLVHISSGPKDRQWPVSFQIQLKNKVVGDLLPMAGATFTEPLTSAAGAATPLKAHTAPDSEKPAGEWNSCDIVCHDDTIEVSINGVDQNKVTGCSVKEGNVGFQLEGTPYELRNVTLAPLEPAQN